MSPATDIYSLGCVAYEMVAGARPFQGDSTVAVAVAHINEAPPALAPTVNPHIRELIGIMLRKDPQRRYADGRELAQAVLRVRAGHRPPQPRGVTPTVHRQSNAANPATTELGAMTRPPMPVSQPPQQPQRPPQQPARQRKPAKKRSGCGCGCGSIVLLVLLVLLAGAIAVVYSLSTTGSLPTIPNLEQYIPNQSQQQTTEENTDPNDGSGYGWSGDNSGNWGNNDGGNSGENYGGNNDGASDSSTEQDTSETAPDTSEPTQDSGNDNGNDSSDGVLPGIQLPLGNDSGNTLGTPDAQ